MNAWATTENGTLLRTVMVRMRPSSSSYSYVSLNHAVPLMNGRDVSVAPAAGLHSPQFPSPQPGITIPLYVSVLLPFSYGSTNVPLTSPVPSVNDSFLSADAMALVLTLAFFVALANVTVTVVTVLGASSSSAPAPRSSVISSSSASPWSAKSFSFDVESAASQQLLKSSALL